MFSPEGPSLRELAVQALSSVERGYDLLAPKFDATPFRTSDRILSSVTRALEGLGPFDAGLDVCCGTGAGLPVLRSVCAGRVTGVDFSANMLAEARRRHPAATLVRADALALPFTASFDLAVSFGAFGHFLLRLRTAAAHESSVLKGGVPAVVVYVVAELVGVDVDTAAALAVYFTVGLLAVVGYLGAHRAGASGRAMALEVAGAASFGVLIVLMKTLLH